MVLDVDIDDLRNALKVESLGGQQLCFGLLDYKNGRWGHSAGAARNAPVGARVVLAVVLAIITAPFLVIDFKAVLDPRVTASDASEWGGGVSKTVGLTSMGRQLVASIPRAAGRTASGKVVLVESFGGIGGARRALELLGVSPAVFISIENRSGLSLS